MATFKSEFKSNFGGGLGAGLALVVVGALVLGGLHVMDKYGKKKKPAPSTTEAKETPAQDPASAPEEQANGI